MDDPATAETVAPWQHAFRDGFAPLLGVGPLEALADALARDSAELMQHGTTTPPAFPGVEDWPVEAACAVGYCGWRGEGLKTVAEVNEYFCRLCAAATERLGEPFGFGRFTGWFDHTPRGEMRPALLAEVRRELGRRAAA
jgi:hypothetical protein